MFFDNNSCPPACLWTSQRWENPPILTECELRHTYGNKSSVQLEPGPFHSFPPTSSPNFWPLTLRTESEGQAVLPSGQRTQEQVISLALFCFYTVFLPEDLVATSPARCSVCPFDQQSISFTGSAADKVFGCTTVITMCSTGIKVGKEIKFWK